MLLVVVLTKCFCALKVVAALFARVRLATVMQSQVIFELQLVLEKPWAVWTVLLAFWVNDVHMSAELLLGCKTPRALGALVGVNARVGCSVPLESTHAFRLEIAVSALVHALALRHGHDVGLGHVVRFLLDRGKFVRAELATVLMVKQVNVLHVATHTEGRLEALATKEAAILACSLLVVPVEVLDQCHICRDTLTTEFTNVPHRPWVTLYVLL